MSGLYLPTTIPKKLITVIASVERKAASPRDMRILQQMSEVMKGIELVRGGEVEIAQVGSSPSVVLHLLKHLKRPGSALIIASDGPWNKGTSGGFDRPFAGHATRHLALGTASLSRMSQRPIVPCVSFLDTDERRVIMEWGEPIAPPAKDDPEGDADVMNAVLDVFERAIGQHPGQYVLPIGDDRRWSEATQRWIEKNDKTDPLVAPEAAPLSSVSAS